MDFALDAAGEQRLKDYFDRIGRVLGDEKRRASFALYAMGLFSDAERKSVEPIAARACADPSRADALHQRLLHFISNSKWSDHGVRREAADYALSAMTAQAPIDAWIVDDTGWLKQGKHSVGVQRQYSGSAGKITNCQTGVTLSLASRYEHLPVDAELYLPVSWTEDPVRRRKAHIPDDIEFATKIDLAVAMLTRAVRDKLPKGVVLADSAYGTSTEFRAHCRELGLHFAVGIDRTLKVWLPYQLLVPDTAVSAADLAMQLPRRAFRRCTWRDGTNAPLQSRFAVLRVIPFHDDGTAPAPASREQLWLVVEWPRGEPQPTKFFLSSLPGRYSQRRRIRLLKERWRTERVYEDLKGELGLDHFEGRSFPGWHHHVTVALCCFAFIVAERSRRFPPSAGWQGQNHPVQLAA